MLGGGGDGGGGGDEGAGGGGGRTGEKGAAAHRVLGRAEGGAAEDRGDDGRRGVGDGPQGDGVVPGEPRGHVGHAPLHETSYLKRRHQK